jgi:hypothetical protein
MSNLYLSFGTVVLLAFFYVSLAWVLMSTHTPPGFTEDEQNPEQVIPALKDLDRGIPVLNATLRVPQLNKPATRSNR